MQILRSIRMQKLKVFSLRQIKPLDYKFILLSTRGKCNLGTNEKFKEWRYLIYFAYISFSIWNWGLQKFFQLSSVKYLNKLFFIFECSSKTPLHIILFVHYQANVFRSKNVMNLFIESNFVN